MNGQSLSKSETLFFVRPPALVELCAVTLTVPIPASEVDKPLGQQPQILRCRELIFTEPNIIATPSLNFENKVMIIMQADRPKRVTAGDYESCLSYTLIARIAPAWNKVGDYLIQGFELRVTEDEMYFVIAPAILKCTPAKLRDLDICTPVIREFMALRPEAKIKEFSIGNKWCHILPSMKRGKVINVHHTIPADSPFKSYKDMKKHWKNTYGYRLPEDDTGLLYYQVYFKLVGEVLFTYPDVCIRPRPALVFPRTDPQPILKAFLADLGNRLPSVCGQTLRIQPQAAYLTPALTTVEEMENAIPSLNNTEPVEENSPSQSHNWHHSLGPNLSVSAPPPRVAYRPSVSLYLQQQKQQQHQQQQQRPQPAPPACHYDVTTTSGSHDNSHTSGTTSSQCGSSSFTRPFSQQGSFSLPDNPSFQQHSPSAQFAQQAKRAISGPRVIPRFGRAFPSQHSHKFSWSQTNSSTTANVPKSVPIFKSSITKPTPPQNRAGPEIPRPTPPTLPGAALRAIKFGATQSPHVRAAQKVSVPRPTLPFGANRGGDGGRPTGQPSTPGAFLEAEEAPSMFSVPHGPFSSTPHAVRPCFSTSMGAKRPPPPSRAPAIITNHQKSTGGGGGYRQTVSADLIGPSQPDMRSSAPKRPKMDKDGQPKKRAKPQLQDIDVEELARVGQLGKANTITLMTWLRGKGVPCKAKDKKSELVDRVVTLLSLNPRS